MTRLHPPSLALALLHRFVPDQEPLAGDLIEEFEVRQSRRWFWRQVLFAIWIEIRQSRHAIRPLKLLGNDDEAEWVAFYAARRDMPKQINLTASPLHGIGGLGLSALVLLVTIVQPHTWWMASTGVLGGIALGLVMIAISRRRMLSTPREGRPATLIDHC